MLIVGKREGGIRGYMSGVPAISTIPPSCCFPRQFLITLSVADSTYAQVEAGPASMTWPLPSAVVIRAKRHDSVRVEGLGQ